MNEENFIKQRKFDYFLFDQFSEEEIREKRDNPREHLNENADKILSEVISGESDYNRLIRLFGNERIDDLIHIGLFRKINSKVLLDALVFLREDVPFLQTCFKDAIHAMISKIKKEEISYKNIVRKCNNGFSEEENLYHLLCGEIFDGCFFDLVSKMDIVATSKVHPSGLDYLIIVYEKSEELDSFSRHLLCSYNRFTDGQRTLQSFGDADGDRFDAFRFSKQVLLGQIPKKYFYLLEK